MPNETKVDSTSFLGRCYIYWKTKDYGRKIEAVALLLAVAIYMNKKIYEEELQSAATYLHTLMENEDDIENVMKYVKMKLGSYQEDNEAWLHDRQEAFNLIIKNEDLYGCMIDIFNSDKTFDENEKLFEEALKRLL